MHKGEFHGMPALFYCHHHETPPATNKDGLEAEGRIVVSENCETLSCVTIRTAKVLAAASRIAAATVTVQNGK